MANKLSLKAIRLIDGKNFAHFATLLPNGSPHVAPVWVDHDGDLILVNTSLGEIKQKNSAKDPRVALSIADQENPYDRVVIEGRAVAQTHDGAEEHMDKLVKKYTGANKYERSSPKEKRIIIEIEAVKIS